MVRVATYVHQMPAGGIGSDAAEIYKALEKGEQYV
jgi:hypothetical protein